MGFEPSIKTETFGGSDRSWIRIPKFGTDTMLPIMLDMSTFSSNHVKNGVIPSGTALGKIGAGPFYGPYAGETDEAVTIQVDATGGTFTITFRGTASAAIAFNATAAAVLAALELNPEIDHGDFAVTGGPGNAGHTTPYIITALPGGQYGDGQNISAFTTGVGSLTGGAATAAVVTVDGAAGASDGREVFAGHLFEDSRVGHVPGQTPDLSTAPDQSAALYWRGVVLESKLPTFGGTNGGVIDAVGKQHAPSLKYV